jgi:membrane-associated phospholipid phosphatase
MAKDVNTIAKPSVEIIKLPVNKWQQTVDESEIVAEKPSRHYRSIVFQSYLVGATVIFIVLAVLAKTVAYFTFDVTITHEIQEINVWWFGALMDVLTWIGFSPQAWFISAGIILFLYLIGLKWEAVVSASSLIGMSALGLGIKLLVERPRPSADLVNVVTHLSDYSFPSGHVLYFTTFIGFLLFLTYTLLKHSWWRFLLLIILGSTVFLIGPARIYAGQHWASDVIAAYLLGTVWLSLSILLYRWGKPRFFANQSTAKEPPDLLSKTE